MKTIYVAVKVGLTPKVVLAGLSKNRVISALK